MEMLIIAVVAIIAFAAVLIPLFRRRADGLDADELGGDESTATRGPATPGARTPAPADTDVVEAPGAPAEAAAEEDVELEVQRYRAALRAGTLCGKCGQANPAESRFCFECGAPLPLGEAREFD